MADDANNSPRILVVDGDVLVRHAIASYLRRCGYVVLEAATTDEAITVLDDRNGINAGLCDVEAPGTINAFQLCRWAREQHAVVVTLAGNIENLAEKAAEFCEEGPELRRPYDPQSVVNYIKRTLAKSEAA